MSADDIKRLLERSPFVPLRLHLSNGQTLDVRHPDFVWVFKSRLEVAVPSADNSRIMDHAEHVALLHIARVEELPMAA
jgi:hypothetical protein